ncbi:deoxyuridine 5'-triphosphate nucleotidohydrolase-like [Triticum urartu]|uniref:deoxyuridine 5'-triphosphate nucleotidohydrolase-like n=1 Tax=Triticum urartu TaxID=4572 RepID=UPI0020435500|nr:deoxyuridine 5'-triphosphate nucleotidohydrolase-like [Triticum urartu]XP_048537649.1 deoxyuridine 5'-triphosphate nucleotidohydrolase-like [Triticum urartu]
MDFKLDESYTPSKISIRAGDGFHNLKEIKTVDLLKPVGWVHISLSGTDPRVIDEDYYGPVGVVLFNYSEADFTVKPRDRVIEIIVQVIATQEVPGVEDLDATVRRSLRWRTTPPSGVPQGGGPRRFVHTSREVVWLGWW